MSSRRALSNKSAADSLCIVEKYSFRGRRKFNSDTLSENNVVEKKSKPGLEIIKTLPKSENNSIHVKQEESVSEFETSTPKVTAKKTKYKNSKNVKIENCKPAVKMETSDNIDIEDCDVMVNRNKVEEDHIKWVPENWEEILSRIRKMRIDASAPVDDMGCHKTMDDNASPKDKRYQALISLMLSSQTRDQVTYATMLKLREHGLSVDNILKTDEEVLRNLIKSVGFYKIKAKHIKLTTQILKDEYDGDIPDTVEKMLKLPGVGPKMANLCMATAWDKVHGIGVDTHVHRISNRLGWVPKPTKTPEKTRIALERWLPHSLWYEINHLMVGLGQQICLPRNPRCGQCLNNNICPVGISELKKKSKKIKVQNRIAKKK